ncbi:cell wall hydrolase [Marinivivus vitaminiproducens]|uniref:cell wall hydrolase n=1 Tax=Marinivivus vitaminiproducens TaxID=3035935 RepID=UPI00279B3EAE|nr:cell wall hydrolase [Geminicoccaceae bacterium SCSIO 64248]
MRPLALPTVLLGLALTTAQASLAAAEEAVAAARPDAKGGAPSYAAEKECLAMTVYWEAKGEGRKGMDAVAAVVMNRVDASEFPTTVCGVVHDGGPDGPCQFAWYCDGKDDTPDEAEMWAQAQQVAEAHLKGRSGDPTAGATYFHTGDAQPAWSEDLEPTTRIGDHEFYKDPDADE